jgi:hypothetical protein
MKGIEEGRTTRAQSTFAYSQLPRACVFVCVGFEFTEVFGEEEVIIEGREREEAQP